MVDVWHILQHVGQFLVADSVVFKVREVVFHTLFDEFVKPCTLGAAEQVLVLDAERHCVRIVLRLIANLLTSSLADGNTSSGGIAVGTTREALRTIRIGDVGVALFIDRDALVTAVDHTHILPSTFAVFLPLGLQFMILCLGHLLDLSLDISTLFDAQLLQDVLADALQ